MSRIDRAIEMAAKIKQSEQRLPEPENKGSVTEPASYLSLEPLQVKNPFLVTVNEPHGIVAEEYNKLKTTILRLANSESGKNTFLVTSAVPSEGKTLTAANLALSMARSTDYSVVLVDADFRRPSIHELFGIEQGPGLAQCLREDLSFDEALVKTDQGKLAILPAGQQMDDPSELFSSMRMKRFIKTVKERNPNCYVIFDSPPVLPFADARLMGSLVDFTIFVARENYSKLKQIEEGLGSLPDAHVLGVIYNDTSFAAGHNYGGYY